MVHVARELERENLDVPLLIGGATTSKKHTAVKIAPQYHSPVVHVLDASKAVGVVSSLLNQKQRKSFIEKIKKEYEGLLTLQQARENRFQSDWSQVPITPPSFLGIRVFHDFPLEKIRERIDWTPFFWAWELHGKFPKIFDNPKYGAEARKLYEDAQKLLDEIVAEKKLTAEAVIGFFPLLLFTLYGNKWSKRINSPIWR